MDLSRVYTKTSKGILEGTAKTRALTREHGRVLALIDGKSPLSIILEKSPRLSESRLAAILDELIEVGFIRLLNDNLAVDDLGFSSTIIVSDANTQAFFDAQADAERELLQAEAHETRAKADAQERLLSEVKADIEAEAQALRQRTEHDAQAQAEQDAARRRAQEAIQLQAEQERKAKEAIAEAQAQAAEAARKAKQEAEQLAQAEAQAKARMEAEKKARKEAEKQAAEAIRAREAAERKAREEANAKMRLAKEAAAIAQREREAKALAEEEARRRTQMEARLREMDNAKRQAEAEAPRLSKAVDEARIAAELETRVKRRLEARAREEIETHEHVQVKGRAKIEQEARLRAEAEAKALAEEAARRQAEQDDRAALEAEREAREAAEQKAREAAEARAQAEETARRQVRKEAARKARKEAERQTQAEEAARRAAEAERQAQLDALARVYAEEAACLQAEQDARRQAEEAARLRTEAEARAVAEAEEAIRREAEMVKRQLEEQQRAEEARHAREAAERKAEQERQTRVAAEAAAKALEDERARMDAAAKSREAARLQAREEAEAEARAETEAALRRAEEEARHEEAEEARLRAEAEARAVAAAQGAQPLAFLVRRPKQRTRFDKRSVKPIALGVAVLLLMVLGIVHLIPFNFYIPTLNRQLSDSLGQNVAVQEIHFSAFPAPHLVLGGVTIGEPVAVRIAKAQLFPTFSSWFSDEKVVRRVALESVALSENSVSALSVWSRRQAQAAPMHFEYLQVKDAKLAHRVLDLFAFDADMEMHRGRFVKAQMRSSDRRITIDFLPQGDALHIDLSAIHSVLPLEPRLQFDALKLSALARDGKVIASDIEGQLYGGSLTGTAKMVWHNGWTFDADLGLRHVAIEPGMSLFTRDVKVDGTLEAKVRLTARAPTLETLFSSPQAQATFQAKNGEFSGIDLVSALQAPSRSGNAAGKTHFNELSGYLQFAKGNYQYRQIKLQGGAISATGYLAINPERELSGNLLGELRTRVTTIRTPFIFGGTLDSPTLRTAAAPQRVAPVPAPVEQEQEQPQ